MSLNNIELPASLVAQLYGKVLVEGAIQKEQPVTGYEEAPTTALEVKEPEAAAYPAKTTQEPLQSTAAPVKFLGKNAKNVLVAVYYNDVVHLPEEDLNFLTQLLNACRLTLQDVAIVNSNNHPGVEGNDIIQELSSKQILLFGIRTDQFGLPFAIPDYQVQQHDQKTIIQAPSLFALKDDKTGKGKLWAGLKRIFEV